MWRLILFFVYAGVSANVNSGENDGNMLENLQMRMSSIENGNLALQNKVKTFEKQNVDLQNEIKDLKQDNQGLLSAVQELSSICEEKKQPKSKIMFQHLRISISL